MGVAVVGVLIVVYRPGVAGDVVGVLLTLAAVAACASYTVLTRRLLVDDGSLPVVLLQQVAALAFAAALAGSVDLVGGQGWSPGSLSRGSWLAAAASGILYYGLAFWFYLAGLRQVPAAVAGAFLPLIPVFGVATGYLVGERLADRQWLGASIVIAATAVVALTQARTEQVP